MTDRARRRGALAIVAVAAAASLAPLAGSSLQMGHDAPPYFERVIEFHESVRAGQLPPVWTAHLAAGHGMPLFEFAPPLLYALGEPLYALGLGIARAVQVPLLVATVAGALALGALARRLAGPGPRPGPVAPGGYEPPAGDAPAVVATVAFLFAPYVHLDLYVRSAFAESLALALMPVVLLATHEAATRPGLHSLTLLALATAAAALAHPPGFLLSMALAGLLALALAAAAGRARPVAAAAGGVAVGLGLAAFSWAPAFLERGLTKTFLLTAGPLHYAQHFLAPRQLLWGRWGHGLTDSGAGDAMAFHVGPLHLALAVAGAAVSLRGDRTLRTVAVAAAAGAIGAVLLTLPVSAPVWERLPLLQSFAYPWRMLAVPAVLLSLLAGLAARRLGLAGAAAVSVLLIAVNVGHVGAASTWRVPHLAPEDLARLELPASYADEYAPVTAPRTASYQAALLELADPAASAAVVTETPERLAFDVSAPRPTAGVLRTYHYPGWTVMAGGSVLASGPEPLTGRIAFTAPAGRYRLVAALRPTPVRRAARWVSLTIVGLLVMVLASWRPDRPARGATPAAERERETAP